MRLRQVVIGVVALAAVTSLVFGTGSFAATSVERDVVVAVAPSDDRAVVAVWDPGVRNTGSAPPARYNSERPVPRDGGDVALLVVRNQFPDRSITVSVSARPESTVDVEGTAVPVDAGETRALSATVACNDEHGRTDVPLELAVESEDRSLTAVIEYDGVIVCQGPPSVEGNGSSDGATAGPSDESTA